MTRRRAGIALLAVVAAAALGAPLLSQHDPLRQFNDYENAPPMPVRVFDASGHVTRPFVYPIVLADRLERRYVEDRSRRMPLRLVPGGYLLGVGDGAPWFPLGADPLGRDVWARLLYGSRVSLSLALVATAGALLLGTLVGGTAGYVGGRVDLALMAAADFILVLPAIFVVLAVRAALPLVLTPGQVFLALSMVLALAGWPIAARGVRAIVAGERRKEYAEAAISAGAGPWRILRHHLLPAAAPFLGVTATLLIPAFILTESTMSLVGLGFPTPSATWGTMMRDGWQGGALTEAPWLMAPAAAIVVTVLAVQWLAPGADSATPTPGTFS